MYKTQSNYGQVSSFNNYTFDLVPSYSVTDRPVGGGDLVYIDDGMFYMYISTLGAIKLDTVDWTIDFRYTLVGLQNIGRTSGQPIFTPTQITGCLFWVDAADSTTITHSSGDVSQWDDKSGNGYHLTQSTAAYEPTYSSVAPYPYIEFDGNNQVLGNTDPGLIGVSDGRNTMFVVFESANTTTSSDQESNTDNINPRENVPLFASEIFPGLEGVSSDPRIEEEYAKQLDDFIEAKTQVMVSTGMQADVVGPVAEVERGSIRSTSFNHLMNSHRSGAASNMKVDLELRGDPWFMGKGSFYDGNNDEGTENNTPIADKTDLQGIAYNSGSNQFLLMIESPRKLDFNIDDEDQNTGFFNYGHLNYTMSGVYTITRVMSKFSGGMYTNDIQGMKMSGYETSKLAKVREIISNRLQQKIDAIGDTMGVGSGTSEDLPENIPPSGGDT